MLMILSCWLPISVRKQCFFENSGPLVFENYPTSAVKQKYVVICYSENVR